LKTFLLLTALIITLAACGTKEQEKAATDTSEKKTEITIATATMPKPFTYVGEKGKLVGYDIEVAKAVFEKLP
jgi:polar amino acid transport system substrate-binding protein